MGLHKLKKDYTHPNMGRIQTMRPRNVSMLHKIFKCDLTLALVAYSSNICRTMLLYNIHFASENIEINCVLTL
jgi:hypothetical protein